jgi:polysaccharide pyruvyl transferase WcaK-like protein
MNILIDHGTMRFDNLGDIAMLQVCIDRLNQQWPGSRLRVLTYDAVEMRRHLDGIEPFEIELPKRWLALRSIVPRNLPLGLGRLANRLEARAALTLPSEYRRAVADGIGDADLYVHAGAGILADAFPSAAGRRLSTIGSAVERGIPTALFSQGIGPLRTPELKRKARGVLPRVDSIGVRDMGSHARLVDDLGVPPKRARLTGDDALSIGFQSRRDSLGLGLGVNVRVSSYSALRPADLRWLASQLKGLMGDAGEFIPLAIHRMDRGATGRLLSRIGDGSSQPWHDHRVPALVQVVGRCRLVITSSYHAAVLSLSQGVPAICLYRSPYYRAKFNGLCDLFPAACRRIDLGRPDDRARLAATAADLSDNASERRPRTLRAVEELITRSERTYQAVKRQYEAHHG